MDAMLTSIEAFFPNDYDLQDLVCSMELLKYKRMEGMFARRLAISGRMKNDDNCDIGKLSNSLILYFLIHVVVLNINIFTRISWMVV